MGYSRLAVDAVWPEWWAAEAEESLSARSGLRISVARRLGLVPSSLFGDTAPTFQWTDSARFKNLGATSPDEQAILSSFTSALAAILIAGAPPPTVQPTGTSAGQLRTILELLGGFGLTQVVALSWALGIPVVQTTVFPLDRKRMHAATGSRGDGSAIILGESTLFPAKAAFSIAHELGHIFLGHLRESETLLDVDDVVRTGTDEEEQAATEFALELLTGSAQPEFDPSNSDYNAASLAGAAQRTANKAKVDPGVIVLCFARRQNDWARGTAALRLLGEINVEQEINHLARRMLLWDEIAADDRHYVESILGTS